MEIEVFKFDKLIATVKQLGYFASYGLYHVTVTGMGDEFEASLEALNHSLAAKEVIGELLFAAEHPRKFFNRRKLAAEQSGATGHDLLKMIDIANEAVAYADRNVQYLERAVQAIYRRRSRRLGGRYA